MSDSSYTEERQARQSAEARDAERLRDIEALRRSGLATWDEEREAFQIRRRQVLRGERERRVVPLRIR